MTAGTTSNTVANMAIQLVGDNQPAVTGLAPTFDNSPAGTALQYLYTETVQAVQRRFEWDASRRFYGLTLSGNSGPYVDGYTYEYLYPSVALEIWNITTAGADPNDPLPTNWTVGNTLVGGVQTKVIWTSIASAYGVYNNQPTESAWDAGFTEAVVRELASKLAMALAGRPETEQSFLQSGEAAIGVAQTRDG